MKLHLVKKHLEEKKLDAIILFNKDPNFKYFVGGDFEHGIMFLTRKGSYLLVSLLYRPRFPGLKVAHWKDFKKDFKIFIKKQGIRRVGISNNNLFVRHKTFLRKHFRIKDVSRFLDSLRESKTKEEILRIRKACMIGDMIFKKIVSNFKFKTEADLVRFLKIEALKAGAELSFEPIVANATNAVVAHHEAKSRLKKGFLILDFGIKYKGYMSDMTRTIYVGKPSKKEAETYEMVLDIQKKCVSKAMIGMKAESLYNHALKLLDKDAKYFVHGLGHGIGVEIHEIPNISLKSKDRLVKGSVFTIEPGYYNPRTGIGIRIEDDVYLGGKKEILTKSPKHLICVQLK